jgi:dolichol-phosphate mannosyltransferase
MMKRAAFEAVAPQLSTQGFKLLADILASTPHRLRTRELSYTFRERNQGESKLDSRVALDFVGLLIAKLTRDTIPVRFFGFTLVGASGILVHLISLRAALELFPLDFAVAQMFATAISMTSNFFLNNAMTYHSQRLTGLVPLTRGLLTFYAICTIGAISNIGVANWMYASKSDWWLAGFAGSLVGAVWNYALSSAYVWRARA